MFQENYGILFFVGGAKLRSSFCDLEWKKNIEMKKQNEKTCDYEKIS